VEEVLLSELCSRNAANLPVNCSSRLRTGDSFRGDGGGLRAVARILGNCGGARVFGLGALVGGVGFGSGAGFWRPSCFPGSNCKSIRSAFYGSGYEAVIVNKVHVT
jgi:hypothetical protein